MIMECYVIRKLTTENTNKLFLHMYNWFNLTAQTQYLTKWWN